jgi:hypothetical protein
MAIECPIDISGLGGDSEGRPRRRPGDGQMPREGRWPGGWPGRARPPPRDRRRPRRGPGSRASQRSRQVTCARRPNFTKSACVGNRCSEVAHFVWAFYSCTDHLHTKALPCQAFLVPFSVTHEIWSELGSVGMCRGEGLWALLPYITCLFPASVITSLGLVSWGSGEPGPRPSPGGGRPLRPRGPRSRCTSSARWPTAHPC